MNPAGDSAHGVQMQGYPQQPGGAAMTPYTAVNVSTEPPKDHIIWSLLSFVYVNPCCLGLAALIFSIKARDRTMVGDLEGARNYASSARYLNIAAAVLFSIIIIIIMITAIVSVIRANDAYRRYGGSYYNRYGYSG